MTTKYEYAWQVILEDEEVLIHDEEYQKVDEAGELVLFDKRTFLGFEYGTRYNTVTYAAGVWASVSPTRLQREDR